MWFTLVGIAAMEGYEGSNARALLQWEKVYPDGALRVALTDTFSTRRKCNSEISCYQLTPTLQHSFTI